MLWISVIKINVSEIHNLRQTIECQSQMLKNQESPGLYMERKDLEITFYPDRALEVTKTLLLVVNYYSQ